MRRSVRLARMATDFDTIRLALKGARGLALDSHEATLDAELAHAIDLLDELGIQTGVYIMVPLTFDPALIKDVSSASSARS
jgi:hypothetical protein